MNTLPDDLIERYNDEGYLSPNFAMNGEEASALRRYFEELEVNYRAKDMPRVIGQYLRSGLDLVVPRAYQVARHPNILAAVQSLLGPNLLLYGTDLFIKEPQTDGFVSWHQDLTYWGLGSTNDEVTVWLALSAASIESGCMRFIPGSHHNDLLDHNDSFAPDNLLSRGQRVQADIDESCAVYAPLQPGEFSLHHGRLFHASSPNRTNDRRIGLVFRYVTPRVRQQVAARDYAMLLCGMDEFNNWVNLAPPVTAFDEASLARYERVLGDRAEALAEGAGAEPSTLRRR